MTGNQLARFLSSVLEGGGSTLTFERPDNVSWALDVREALGVVDGLIAHATSLDDQVQEHPDGADPLRGSVAHLRSASPVVRRLVGWWRRRSEIRARDRWDFRPAPVVRPGRWNW